MDDLETRLRKLECSVTRWKRLTATAIVCGLAALLLGAARNNVFANEVVAQSLHLVDAEGQRYCFFGTVDGNPRFALKNKGERTVFSLDVDNGQPVMRLFDEQGHERLAMGRHNNGISLRITDMEPQPVLNFEFAGDKTMLLMRDKEGRLKQIGVR